MADPAAAAEAQADPTRAASCAPVGAAPGVAYTLAALAFFAHNVEEIAGLVAWRAAHPVGPFAGLLAPVTQSQFANAVSWLTLAAFGAYLLGRGFKFNRPVQIGVAALAGGLVTNAASHAGLSLATGSLMPGTWTAMLAVAPLNLWLLARLPLARRTLWLAALAGGALMPVLAAAALALAA